MEGLARPATRGGHANVLQHLSGYLKGDLDAVTKRQLLESIDDYRRGEIGLTTPLTLLRQHLQRGSHGYALAQIYVESHPHGGDAARELLTPTRDD